MIDDATLAALADRLYERLVTRFGAAAAAVGSAPAGLLTKRDAALYFSVTTAQIDRWVRKGMPRAVVGASPRFDLESCKTWLAQNAQQRQTPTTRGRVAHGGVTLLSRKRAG